MTRADFQRNASLLLSHLDPMTIRFLMMAASFWWGFFLIIYPNTFNRHGYEFIRYVGNEYFWAFLFLLHGVSALWRFMEARSRPNWTKIIHMYGLAVWSYSTACTNMAIGQISPATGMEWIMVFAGLIALAKTGTKREVVTL